MQVESKSLLLSALKEIVCVCVCVFSGVELGLVCVHARPCSVSWVPITSLITGGAVKEPKLNRRDRFGRKVVILNIFRVNETMARTGVNQGKKMKDDNDWRAIRLRAGANFRRE